MSVPASHRSPTGTSRTVRPRWVWGGTAAALLGCAVVAVGTIVLSWTVSVVGLLLLGLGAVVAVAGGVLYDVRSGKPIPHGQGGPGVVHEGVAPGDTLDSARVREDARASDRRRRDLERAAMDAPRPSMVPLAGGLLLLTCVFLLVSQWGLYPSGRPGQTNATRALGCAVVLGIAGSRMATAREGEPRAWAGAFALLAGLALVLNGSLAPHDQVSTAVSEVVCGVLACLGAAVAGRAAVRRRGGRR